MNSTIGYLFQQLRMRNNLGDGAGKIEKYELADFPFIDVNLEEFQLDLGPLKNLKEEFGDLRTIQSVSDTRRRLDLKLLQAIGFHNKEEREKVLFELYKATYQLIENRFLKAQSLKSIKVQRSKIPFEVYLDQLRNMLVESKIKASNSLRFARDLRNLIEKITSETKLQKKIFDVYWKEKYGEIYNEKKVAEQLQGKIF